MGCDLHLHTEVKIDGQWEHYAEGNMDRDYQLFELMAGVRGDEDMAISPPRGMPEDASKLTRIICDDYGEDGHSHSYLTASEIPRLEEFFRKVRDDNFPERQWGYFFCNTWGGFSLHPKGIPHMIQDVRFVFWFDN